MIQDGASQVALTLNGAGTQVLTGSNTYTGVTTITAGTLQLGNGGGSGSINNSSGVVNNGLLVFNRSGNAVFTPSISGSGGLTQLGPGILALLGNNTYTGPTLISAGTLQAYTPNPNTPAPLIHYTFNGPLGPVGTVPDVSGNGYTLERWSGGAANYVPGKLGNAVSTVVNGSNGSMLYTGPWSTSYGQPQLPTLNTWTTSEWVSLPAASLAGMAPIMGSGFNGPAGVNLTYWSSSYYSGFPYQTGFQAWVGDSTGTQWVVGGLNIPVPMVADTWYLLTETVTPSQFNFYVNGALVVGQAISPGVTPQFSVGSQTDLTLGFAAGWGAGSSMDDFNLFGSG